VKIRQGFVSNSSSSSFVLSLNLISGYQLQKILEPDYSSQYLDDQDRWFVEVEDLTQTVKGYTSQDNFSMADYFTQIGVNPSLASWSD